jgi:predicted DNA-binding transcriptional regulator YafY
MRKKLALDDFEILRVLTLLRAFKEGLLVNIDQEWEEEEYGGALVDDRTLDRLIRKMESAAGDLQSVEAVRNAVLVRKYHPYHNEVDEKLYAIFERAFRMRRRIEMEYFSLHRREVTRREIDVYHLSKKYLVARDYLTGEVRTFRTSRVVNVAIKKERYEIPAGFDKGSNR